MKTASLVLAFASLLACSSASNVASSSAAVAGDSVDVRGCTYSVDVVTQAGFPPQYAAVLERAASKRCAAGSLVLGTSYASPSVAIAKGHGEIVVDWSSKSTPSGEAHTQLFIALVSTDLVVEKQVELAAMPDFQNPSLGNVYDGALDVKGQKLVVTGDKNGVIPGETGSGDHYTATYDRFFDSDETAPDSVVAY